MPHTTPSSHSAFNWQSFILRFVIPIILTIALYVLAIFFMLIPLIEKNSIVRKQEMIQELTKSAWNILAKLENDERNGLLTREEAQQHAIEQIGNLHYGLEMKDYFWINDMHPRMVIHPYRSDLNGQDVTDYQDPDGKHVFVEMVETVRKNGAGFVSYKWQARDNIHNVIPKLSYVKGFEPWGWIIGTGIYIDDVKAEISAINRSVLLFSGSILLVMMLLMGSMLSISYKAHLLQQEAAAELHQAQTSLAISEKMASLGKLSAMVAHEINNPLAGILSYARLTGRYLEQKESCAVHLDTLRENLTLIADEAKRCGNIVKNLLQFARQSVGDVGRAHVNEIISVSTRIIEHSAKMKNIELKTEPGPGDDMLQCDAGAIQQILVALIVNAIEASPEGRDILVATDCADPDYVSLRIRDFGCGIPKEDLHKIFEPFFSTKESNKSLGLGLAAVYGIVQRHAGTIKVDSTQGSGTTFTIQLPRRHTPENV
jgi:signal transduction histidine kinase